MEKWKWTIGSRTKKRADILLDDDTVSGEHAELVYKDGKFHLSDLKSTNGTYRLKDGQWQRISQCYVMLDDRLRFGREQITVRELLRRRSPVNPVREMFESFFKLKEAKLYFSFAFSLFADPVKGTMDVVDRGSRINPVSFMAFGFLVFVTAALLRVMTFRRHEQALDIVSIGFGFLLVVFCFWGITYRVFMDVSRCTRTAEDFLKMSAIYSGLNFILLGLMNFSTLVLERMGGLTSLERLKAILLIMIGVYLTVQFIRLSKHFWEISYGKIIFYYFVCSVTLSTFISIGVWLVRNE